jgi:hypothetical protein
MAKKMVLLIWKAWTEGQHPRDGQGQFTITPDTGTNPPIGSKGGKRPASLKDHIHTILHGTPEEKKKLEGRHFHLADTPQFMKELTGNEIKGEYFTASYGVISHHKNKDNDHNLTEEEWVELCGAITRPFAITTYADGHNLFTEVKHNGKPVMVGIMLKPFGKGIAINAIKTAFGVKSIKGDKIIYQSEKITPEQEAFLGRTNSVNSNLSGTTSIVSTKRLKKSRLYIKYRRLA